MKIRVADKNLSKSNIRKTKVVSNKRRKTLYKFLFVISLLLNIYFSNQIYHYDVYLINQIHQILQK
jgi:hypothetical protein